jgi:hypothetical protein
MRSRRTEVAALAALFSLAGMSCALGEGDPWGVADVDVSAELALESGRLDAQGRVATSRDFALAIEVLTLHVDRVELVQGVSATDFDPANPPAGYGLCHNGHCHRDDGALVPYDEIAGDASSATVTPLESGATLDLMTGLAATTRVECARADEGCDVPRGEIASIGVVGDLEVRARVFDTRSGDQARVPAEGVEVAFRTDTVSIDTPWERSVDNGSPLRVGVDLVLTVPGAVFDGVDWDAAEAAATLAAAFAARVGEEASLQVAAR